MRIFLLKEFNSVVNQSKIWLSKSTYLKSLQCKKAFYLYKFHYNLQDKPSANTLKLFQQGHHVEAKARELLFSGGIQLKPKSPRGWQKTIKATQLLIQNQQPILYEAAFSYQGMMCAVDVLKVEQDGITIVEIKRGQHLKDVYIRDMAFQYFVVHQLGYHVKDVVFTSFVGDFSKPELTQNDFKQVSVLEYVKEEFLFVEEQTLLAERIFQFDEIPQVDMGKQCNHPYDCSFIGFCQQQLKTNQEL